MSEYIWLPSDGKWGKRSHAVPAGETLANGQALTACSPSRPIALTRDAAGLDYPQCGRCEKAVAAVCGTYTGYHGHRRRGEAACEPCRAANAEYTRNHRQRHPTLVEQGRAQSAARSRAHTRLAQEFPDRFQELYAAELGRAR